MSGYQYYEFQAIDEPLTDEVQQELRQISSRAQVTPGGFINVYNYGDIRADPLDLLQRYFDAFCYVTNWGIRELIFRIPVDLINEEQARIYCVEDIAGFRRKGDFLIIGFDSQSEEYEWAEGEGWLSSMVSLREDIIRGDFRCLYLAWLLGVQLDLVDPGEPEPVVPPGLDSLNGALSTFIRFMRIDQDLVTVAARGSKSISESEEHQQVKTWICTLENDEKDDIIFRLIIGNEVHLGKKLYHRFLNTVQGCADEPEYYGLRSGGELLEQAEIYGEERRKKEAEERAWKQAFKKTAGP